MKNILTTLLLLLSAVSFAQTKVQLEVENENGKEQYKLKLEREVDGSKEVIEKTYNSKEKMKNDPDLEGLDVHIVTSDMGSDDHEMVFVENGKEGKEVKIEVTVDEDGTKHIFKNGEEVAIENLHKEGEHEMIFISDEGDETNIKELKETGHKVMFISEDSDEEGEVKIEVTVDEDGTKHVFKNGEEIDMDELHESSGNVFVLKSEDDKNVHIEQSMEIEVTVDEDGKHQVTVNGEPVDYEEWKKTNGSDKMEWVEEGENGREVKKEIIIIRDEGADAKNTKVEVIVHERVLHLEEINAEDEKAFSIEENKNLKLDEFNFYPNPSNGSFNLKFEGKEKPTKVRVTDINGKEMYLEDLQNFSGKYNNEINLPGLKKGIYLLQVVQGSKAVNKKIVIE